MLSVLWELVMGLCHWHILLHRWPLAGCAIDEECFTWKRVHKSHSWQHMFLHTSTPYSVKCCKHTLIFPEPMWTLTNHLFFLYLWYWYIPAHLKWKLTKPSCMKQAGKIIIEVSVMSTWTRKGISDIFLVCIFIVWLLFCCKARTLASCNSKSSLLRLRRCSDGWQPKRSSVR